MSLTQFAQKVNHPLCEYMDQIPFHKANHEKERVQFLSGDPTAYGNHNFKMPQQGYDIIRNIIANEANHGYTLSTGVPLPRAAIARLYSPKIPINEAQVIIQHGANQGLLSALMSFTNPGDEILVPEIGYPIFQKLAPSLSVKVQHYRLKADKNFQIDLDHAASLVNERTQFMFVINPSNPMGTVFSREHMEEVLAFCDTHQMPLVSDEVYHKQTFTGVDFHSFGDITENVPVLVVSGVQKIFSVPGWSTSWSVLFDKHGYLDRVWKNLQTTATMFLHTNKFTQLALPEIFQKVGLFTCEKVKELKSVHDGIFDKFQKMKGYHPIRANGTIYITIRIDPSAFKDIANDIEYVNAILEQQNVAVLPLSCFGGSLHGFRILTVAKQETYNALFSRIQIFNSKHQ